MFLKRVLNQPNLVGTVLIALMVCGGFVYTFAADGFNVETVPGSEVEAWLAAAGGGSYDDEDDEGEAVCTCGNTACSAEVSVWDDEDEEWKTETKHGCNTDNKCGGQTKTYPCKLNQGCRTNKGYASHNCVAKCGRQAPDDQAPGYIDICIKSPKKPCKGKCK